jgi:hypothetical protein
VRSSSQQALDVAAALLFPVFEMTGDVASDHAPYFIARLAGCA